LFVILGISRFITMKAVGNVPLSWRYRMDGKVLHRITVTVARRYRFVIEHSK
jgi:hypothetical protein